MKIGWPQSLIGRILSIELATVGVAMLALPPLTMSLLQGVATRYQNDVQQAQAQAVAAGLRHGPDGRWLVDLSPAIKPIFATGYDGRAYIVVDRFGRLVAASLFGKPELIASAPRIMAARPFHTRRLTGLSVPVRADNQIFWIVITQDQDRPGVILDDVMRVFLPRYLTILLFLLLLLPLINSLMVRRLVKAVRLVSSRAATIDARNLHVRLAESGLPTEIAPLVHATNGLVERLGASFRQQGEFSANVAHELRTPLATLQLQIDAVKEDRVREQLSFQVNRLSHVLSQLRDLASLEPQTEEGMTRVDLRALALRVVSDMAPAIIAQQHAIELAGDDKVIFVAGNEMLIELALRNLIDNATRHTPPGVLIRITPEATGSISVQDNGPGIVAENLHLLTRRFWRADHHRSDSAGIGLSIVQRIVDVHRGSMEIRNCEPHGSCFILHFRHCSM